jgi:hypothetical protein
VRGRLLVVALLPLLAACEGRATPAARPAVPSVTTVWHPLGTWSGRGDRQTESFDVTTGSLRVEWQTTGESAPGAGRFRVSLYSSISGRPLQTIVDTRGAGADTVRFADEPRVTYLQIESDQVDWRITLDEAVASGAATASVRK